MRRLLSLLPMSAILAACPNGQGASGDLPPLDAPPPKLAPFEVRADPVRIFQWVYSPLRLRVLNYGADPIAPGEIYYDGSDRSVTQEPARADRAIAPGAEVELTVFLRATELGAFSGTVRFDGEAGVASAAIRGRVIACPHLEVASTLGFAPIGVERTATATLSNGSAEDFAYHSIVDGADDSWTIAPLSGVLRARDRVRIEVAHVIGEDLGSISVRTELDDAPECSTTWALIAGSRELACATKDASAWCQNVSAKSVFIDRFALEGSGRIEPEAIELPHRLRPVEGLGLRLHDATLPATIWIEWRTSTEPRDPIRIDFPHI